MKRAGLVLALVALVMWAVLLVQAEGSVFALVPILDEVWYLDRAAELDGLRAPADEAHFMSPLYPMLVKLTGAGGGVPDDRVVPPANVRGLRLLQIACWFAVAVLLRRFAGRWLPADAPGRRWLIWLPTLFFALYLPAAVYALAVLVELPLLFLVTLTLALLPAPGDSDVRKHWARAVAVGAVLGLAGLLRGSALVLVPVAMVAMGMGRGHWRHAVLVLAASVVVLLPAVVHNSRVSGKPVGPTLNAGVNLAVGNGPEANGFYVAVVPGDWREDPAGRAHLARQLGRDGISLAEADSIWTAWARQSVLEAPGRTLSLWFKKIWLHLQAWEIDQLTPLNGWRATVPALRVMVVPWALVVILAAVGVVDLIRRRPAAWWVLPGTVAALVLLQSVFFVVSRYRLSLLPALVVLAAMGVAALGVAALGARPRRQLVVMVPAVVLAALVVIPWGLGPVQERWQAQAMANEALRRAELGRALQDSAETDRAEALYRTALEQGADGAAPWLGLAAILDDRGEAGQAIEVLARGVIHEDRNLEMRKVLVSHLLAEGRQQEALARLQALLEQWPHDPDALHNMTILLAGQGRLGDALVHAERLVAAAPGDPRGYNDLGILLARLGRREEAAEAFRRGLKAVPGDPDLSANLAHLDDS